MAVDASFILKYADLGLYRYSIIKNLRWRLHHDYISSRGIVKNRSKFWVRTFCQPILQPVIVQECLEEHGKDKCRKGTILTPFVLVWLCIALALRRDLNYNKALNWVFAGVRWNTVELACKNCEGRSRKPCARKIWSNAIFRDIFTKFVSNRSKKLLRRFSWVCLCNFRRNINGNARHGKQSKKIWQTQSGERIRGISSTASSCIDDCVRSMHHRHRLRTLQRQKDGRKNFDVRNSEKMSSKKLLVPFRRGLLLLFISVSYV